MPDVISQQAPAEMTDIHEAGEEKSSASFKERRAGNNRIHAPTPITGNNMKRNEV